MLFNNAISAVAGLVPIVGNFVTAAFKTNSRNASLLEEYLLSEEKLWHEACTTDCRPSTVPFDVSSLKNDQAVQVDGEDASEMDDDSPYADRIRLAAKHIFHDVSQTWASQSQYKHEYVLPDYQTKLIF
jgi:hypothetical protein